MGTKTKKLIIRIAYLLCYKSYIFQIYGRSTGLVGKFYHFVLLNAHCSTKRIGLFYVLFFKHSK